MRNSDLEVAAMEIFRLERGTTMEFFEVYKDVLPEYSAIC